MAKEPAGLWANQHGRFERRAFVCQVEGCTNPVQSRGYCTAHYTRLIRHGDPLRGGTSKGAPLAFLRSLVGTEEEACIDWPFAKDKTGYGFASFRGRMQTAARVMCFIAHGEPPTRKHQAAHNCGRGSDGCVNPRHLRWDTPSGNQNDRLEHGTHNRGDQGRAGTLLTEETVREMRRKHASGQSYAAIAREYDCHYLTTRAAIKGITWAWLNDQP